MYMYTNVHLQCTNVYMYMYTTRHTYSQRVPRAANLVIIIYDVASMQSTPTYKGDLVASYMEDA